MARVKLLLRRAASSAAAVAVLAACGPTPPPPPRLPPVNWLVKIEPDCVAAGVGIWRATIPRTGDYNVRVLYAPPEDGTPQRLTAGAPWTIVGTSVSLPFHALWRNAEGRWVQASAIVTTMPARVCPTSSAR